MSYLSFGRLVFRDKQALALFSVECEPPPGQFSLQTENRIPTIVRKMIGISPPNSFEFLLVKNSTEDTSDSLFSPFQTQPQEIQTNIITLARWIETVFAAPSIIAADLWITEGYESSFQERTCRPEALESVLLAKFQEHGDIASTRIGVSRQ